MLFGVSYSKPNATSGANGIEQVNSSESQISYRAGVTYEFLPRTNAYVSYSQSFIPQTQLEIDLKVLPPLSGEQYEGGLKYRSDDGRLLLTGALFQIDEKNVSQYAQTVNGIDYYAPVGEVRHKGLELQAIGQITRQLQINTGYAYLDPKVTSDSDAAAVGQTELFLPKQTFSVYLTYTMQAWVLRGLSVGGGTRYVSAQRTSYDGSTKDIPSYSLVDAMVSYTVDKWSLQMNARNLFDKRYFINNYQTLFYGNLPGQPMNVAVSVQRTF